MRQRESIRSPHGARSFKTPYRCSLSCLHYSTMMGSVEWGLRVDYQSKINGVIQSSMLRKTSPEGVIVKAVSFSLKTEAAAAEGVIKRKRAGEYGGQSLRIMLSKRIRLFCAAGLCALSSYLTRPCLAGSICGAVGLMNQPAEQNWHTRTR